MANPCATNRDGPRTKRRRSESAEGSSLALAATTKFTRFEHLWFSDGNVVLQAQHTQFRVHCTLLSTQSTFLKKIFTAIQPKTSTTDSSELIEGCPLIRLTDSAADWKNVLETVYLGLAVTKWRGPIKVSRLVAMLRLGHKYDFAHLKEEGLDRLMAVYPDNLETFMGARNGVDLEWDGGWTFCDLVNLAIELRLQRLLPALYLRAMCSMAFTMTELLYDGLTRSPGGERVKIHPSAHKALVMGRDAIIARMHTDIFGFLSSVYEWRSPTDTSASTELGFQDCTSPECRRSKGLIHYHVFVPTTQLHAIFMNWDSHQLGQGICDECRRDIDLWGARNRLWEALPQIFFLGNEWKDLKNFDCDSDLHRSAVP
ncbi:hypothetical protein FA15DRAFT_671008 [Coprinopsis marcescibilis]|uniref:BTB domain-containing protein n=1 Tax=Coprinopsis marcescibilis TaxID=230819 RepID=A0A5C3KR87_COPMA|nr:hypothetical protein FA15DRAFT_671008 [Coprinopsis marcescibilis]